MRCERQQIENLNVKNIFLTSMNLIFYPPWTPRKQAIVTYLLTIVHRLL